MIEDKISRKIWICEWFFGQLFEVQEISLEMKSVAKVVTKFEFVTNFATKYFEI